MGEKSKSQNASQKPFKFKGESMLFPRIFTENDQIRLWISKVFRRRFPVPGKSTWCNGFLRFSSAQNEVNCVRNSSPKSMRISLSFTKIHVILVNCLTFARPRFRNSEMLIFIDTKSLFRRSGNTSQKYCVFKGIFMNFLGISLKMIKSTNEFTRFFGGVFRFRKSRLGVMVFHDFRESKTRSIPQVTVVHSDWLFRFFH